MNLRYPYSAPTITKDDIDMVIKSLKKGYLTQGEQLIRFEKSLSKSFQSKYVSVCNSGTAALHILYKSLGVGPDAAICTTPITFLATANAAKMCNSDVVFSDVNPETGLITAEKIENTIKNSKKKIKVITVVHLGGRVCDLKKISKVAKKYNCYLVEDACHAPGAFFYDKNNSYKIGSCKYSIASTFSFHAIKHITMGEGGCVSTNNKNLINKIKLIRNHGMNKNLRKLKYPPEKNALWYYEMEELGWNYRANEMSCALGLSQLKKLNINIKKRVDIANFYYDKLYNLDNIILPKKSLHNLENVWHLFPLKINFNEIKKTRGQIMKELSLSGIGSQVHYIPLYLQPYYKENKNKYPGANAYYRDTLSIPMHINLNYKDLSYIIKRIKEIIK